jgi:hypothetical protein
MYTWQKHGQAEYNQHMQIPSGDYEAIIQGENDPIKLNERFAQIVYPIGSETTNSSLIELVSQLNSVIQTPGTTSAEKIIQLGVIASNTVPIEVAAGETTALWADTFGRLIGAAFNLALGADDVNQINQAVLNRMGPIEVVPSAEGDYAGTIEVDVSNYHNLTFHIASINGSVATSVDADVLIQTSLDGSNWATISTTNVTTEAKTEVSVSQCAYKYVRVQIDNWNDGVFSANLYCGN